MSKITRIAEYSVKINNLKRKPETDFSHMLPYFELEEEIQEEKTVQYKSCSKGETKINPDDYFKKQTICRKCHNENMRKRRKMYK